MGRRDSWLATIGEVPANGIVGTVKGVPYPPDRIPAMLGKESHPEAIEKILGGDDANTDKARAKISRARKGRSHLPQRLQRQWRRV